MNYLTFSVDDWLDHLENRYVDEIQLGLTRVMKVALHLKLLDWHAKIITVAGTNGKGSTVAALESIYMAAGYQVATYTSPHLLSFNERICVQRQPITNEALCEAFRLIEVARLETPLTYFEVTTLAALWYFKQFKLDVIILEVGLGGRLDATNIINADLAIITTIDLDHQAYLGHTKEAIGLEKAGILRPQKPFIYADVNPPKSIIKQAQALKTPMYYLGVDYSFEIFHDTVQVELSDRLQKITKQTSLFHLPLPTIHLNAAIAACMASLCLATYLPVNLVQLGQAMQKISIKGRQQVIGDTVKTVFDVSHNPQAVKLLANFLNNQRDTKGKIHAVFSALKDKDLCGLINPMQSCVDFWYPAILVNPRAATEALLKSAFNAENCLVPHWFEGPLAAYHAAQLKAKPGDLIVVYGSFLTVNAVMLAEYREEL